MTRRDGLSRRLWSTLRTATSDLTLLVWPGRCGACEQSLSSDEGLFCTTCAAEQAPSAPLCVPDGLDAAHALFAYQGPLRTALHKWKYQRRTAIGRALCEHFARSLEGARPWGFDADVLASGPLYVVPVPTHDSRVKERGFDHTWALGRAAMRPLSGLGNELRWLPEALSRVRATENLPGLDVRARQKALAGAFSSRTKRCLEQAHVLLIDDVLTSGTTATECACALRERGASWVGILTLAYTRQTPLASEEVTARER